MFIQVNKKLAKVVFPKKNKILRLLKNKFKDSENRKLLLQQKLLLLSKNEIAKVFDYFYKYIFNSPNTKWKIDEYSKKTFLKEIKFVERLLWLDECLIELTNEDKKIKNELKNLNKKLIKKLLLFSAFHWISDLLYLFIEYEINTDKTSQITTEIALKIIVYKIKTATNLIEKENYYNYL